MDLQQQQTGVTQTDNPQAANQPDLDQSEVNLQNTQKSDINQLSTQSVTVTANCVTVCSGSIPPPNTAQPTGISGATWAIIAVGIVIVVVLAWMFRNLMGSPTNHK